MMYVSLLEKIFKAYPMYHKIGSAAYKEGLENIEMLAEMTGNPEKKFKSIHIAGTNGKGSVAHLLASYFKEAGLKTGLYTSPHLVDFRERIKINGEMISEKHVLDFFRQFQDKFDQIEPSFFEMTTMLAFHYFALQKVDIAIIETGLGGRLDATNIISPELAVITNISLDHTHLLGNSIQKIAYEKGGIIKPHVPVVIGEYHPDSWSVFEAMATQKESPLWLADRHFYTDKEKDKILIFKGKQQWATVQCNTPLPDYQLRNLTTFAQAVEVTKTLVNPKEERVNSAIQDFFCHNGFRGRWEILSANPYTICDVGHNPDGIAAVVKQLQNTKFRHLHFVIGMVEDKDIDAVLALLPQKNSTYYICRANIPRAIPPEKLSMFFSSKGLQNKPFHTVKEAITKAQEACQPEDLIFIGGSCFVVGEALGN